MLLGTRWTDLVVQEICFVKEAIEIKRKDIKSIKLARCKEHYKIGFVKEKWNAQI
jgi:hypothetical protein